MVASTSAALALRPPMPRRPSPVLSSAPPLPARLRAALESLEVPTCKCKLLTVPVCIGDRQPGCSERRRYGSCPCAPRWLPSCLLWEAHGCERRHEGKSCRCAAMLMPECLALGCDRRRRGRLCECPRSPGKPCEHLTSYATRMRMGAAFQIIAEYCPPGVDFEAYWALLLWTTGAKRFVDRELPGSGADLRERSDCVAMMELRETLHLSLWHPEDIRMSSRPSAMRRLEAQAQNFARLLAREEKGGSHDRAS